MTAVTLVATPDPDAWRSLPVWAVKARILVVELDPSDPAIELYAVADELVMDNNPNYLGDQVMAMRAAYGDDVITYGFVDVEIPDDVLRSVLTRHADAGVVAAVPVKGVGA